LTLLVWLKLGSSSSHVSVLYWIRAYRKLIVGTAPITVVGSPLEQEEAVSASQEKWQAHRIVVLFVSSLLQSYNASTSEQTVIWVSTKNLPNEESKHVTLVRIAEEPIIPLLELNRQARNLIRT
jgi:hypothetical protein